MKTEKQVRVELKRMIDFSNLIVESINICHKNGDIFQMVESAQKLVRAGAAIHCLKTHLNESTQ